MNPSEIFLVDRYHQLLMSIAKTARNCSRDPAEIQLVAVSKGHSWDHIEPLYFQGKNVFAENRLSEGIGKIIEANAKGCDDIEWHYIGSLQKNKVQKIVKYFSMIHSVDSFELAKKISDVSVKESITAKILIQVNTSGELSKHGLNKNESDSIIDTILSLPGISVEGLMTMAPLTENTEVIRASFRDLRLLQESLKKRYGMLTFPHLSMGMSNDYKIAIEEGSTILRIGSLLWA